MGEAPRERFKGSLAGSSKEKIPPAAAAVVLLLPYVPTTPTALQFEAKEEFEIDSEAGGEATEDAAASVEDVNDKFTIEDSPEELCIVVLLVEVLTEEDSFNESSKKLLAFAVEVGGMSIVWVSLPNIKRRRFF